MSDICHNDHFNLQDTKSSLMQMLHVFTKLDVVDSFVCYLK